MMYKFIFLLVLLTFISCKKNADEITTTDVDIVFHIKYEQAPVILLTPYIYTNNQKILFQKIDFYMSSFSFSKADALEKTELKPIDFIDATTILNTLNTSEAGYHYSLSNVPTGNYNGLLFNLGVDPILNATHPSAYSSSHPLSLTDHYWVPWNTYIFAKIEGKLDSDNDGDFETPFSYHIGTDAMLQNIDLVKSFDLEADKIIALNINLNLEKIFIQNNVSMDILAHPTTHNPVDSIYAQFISNGFKNAFDID